MKAQVKAFLPMPVLDASIISSTIPEPHPDEPAWNTSTAFAEFATVSVIKPDSHLVYESLQALNSGNDPETSPSWWIKKSYTNRWRMFDLYSTLPSVASSPFEMVLRPGVRINALILDGLKSTLFELSVQDGIGGPVIYTLDGYLMSRNPTSFYEFFYAPFVYDRIVSTFNIPPSTDPIITIKLEDPSGTCEIGRVGYGIASTLGYVDWNTVADDGGYSDIKFDKNGWPTLEPINGPSTLEMVLDLDAIKVNAVTQFKKLSKNKMVFWSAMETLESYKQMHIMIGVPEKFDITTLSHRQANANLRLKGI